MKRIQISREVQHIAFLDVEAKLVERLKKHGLGGYVGAHETLGIVAEEYHELIDAVRSNDPDAVEAELIDVAVGCIFGIASLRENRRIKTEVV